MDLMQGANAASHSLECARDASNAIVNIRRPVERSDHFIHVLDDRARVFFKKETGAQYREADSQCPQPRAEAEEIGVHQRFAAGEDNPLDAERFDVGGVAVEVLDGNFLGVRRLPDVTHHTATVTAAVWVEYEDRQFHSINSRPARRISLNGSCRRNLDTLAATKTLPRPRTCMRCRRQTGRADSFILPGTRTSSSRLACISASAGARRLSAIAIKSAGPPGTISPNPRGRRIIRAASSVT